MNLLDNAAATVESTPPLTAMMAFPSIFLASVSATLRNFFTSHFPLQKPQIPAKFSRILEPFGVCPTSGWNCRPYMRPFRKAAIFDSPLDAIVLNPFGRPETTSPWDIQHIPLPPNPENIASFETKSSANPYSPTPPFSTFPPSR